MTGDPPSQVGKTSLCSSTHSPPPVAATHMCKLPSATTSPFLLGQERSREPPVGKQLGDLGALLRRDQPKHRARGKRGS